MVSSQNTGHLRGPEVKVSRIDGESSINVNDDSSTPDWYDCNDQFQLQILDNRRNEFHATTAQPQEQSVEVEALFPYGRKGEMTVEEMLEYRARREASRLEE